MEGQDKDGLCELVFVMSLAWYMIPARELDNLAGYRA